MLDWRPEGHREPKIPRNTQRLTVSALKEEVTGCLRCHRERQGFLPSSSREILQKGWCSARFRERKVTTSEVRQLPEQQLCYEISCHWVICLLGIISALYNTAFHLWCYSSKRKTWSPSTGCAPPPSLLGWETTIGFAEGSKRICRSAKTKKISS